MDGIGAVKSAGAIKDHEREFPVRLVLTATLIELTPGPNMGYLAVLAASAGRRAGLAATAVSRWDC